MYARMMIALVSCVCLLCALAAGQQQSDAATVYGKFNAFCIKHFGAEKEPLVNEKFGNDLKVTENGSWQHVSETSACIAFETNLPAKSTVEYGETAQYGKRTPEPERHFYLHVHYLKGLETGKTYHYRFVATDERGKRIETKDATFKTAKIAGAVRVPGEMDGPPYVLDKKGATYVITKDLTIDGMAFITKAPDVTLDLDGHTVVYNNKPVGKGQGASGVRAIDPQNLRVFNGTIVQGAGNNAGTNVGSYGFNPIYIRKGANVEIAGVTVRYAGPQQIGINVYWGKGAVDSEIHHNVFMDTGAKVLNRHGSGCRALFLSSKGTRVHHNLVKRTRQSGISGMKLYNNEVYVDSMDTNAFAVTPAEGGEAWGNRVFGTGFHVCAIGAAHKGTFHDNFIQLEGQKPRAHSSGDHAAMSATSCSLNGFRLTQYGRGPGRPYYDNLYYGNTVVVVARGGQGSRGRGTQFSSAPETKNLIFRNNILKVLSGDGKTDEAACVVTHGRPTSPPVTYKDNTFVSNICNVRFGDGYSVGCNHHFHDCKFVRIGNDPRYRTFFWKQRSSAPCNGHVFRDCVFEGGAGLDSMNAFSSGKCDFTVQWTLTVKTTPGADVTITDKTGKEVFSGTADDKGLVSAPLSQYRLHAQGKTFFTPHTVKVEKAGKSATANVTADAKKTVTVPIR